MFISGTVLKHTICIQKSVQFLLEFYFSGLYVAVSWQVNQNIHVFILIFFSRTDVKGMI